ncbi:arsenate reductase family protein [Bifidobacterium sp. ESL0732]|uniref:arsenate reductase family protein n=1 Tax=Bifidobacterium sp. ESL0732 TaxID=2983222 RepID=UPI0032AFA9C5
MLFVCYNHCSTCAKARKWLGENNIDFTERDIKGDNPTAAELKRWWKASGLPLKRFFNTSGMPYREMKLKTKLPEMSEDEQLKLLATNGMLVKRPIVVNANTILVGFDPETWKNTFSSRGDKLK